MTYLLPAVIEPDDYIKICVTIPNRPEYINAFLGSYNYLGRWTAWEQDGTTRARDAARVWLAAIQDTITRWENCGEDMTTIVNNYIDVNCGGCSGGIPTTIYCVNQDGTVIPTPQPITEPIPQAPPGLEYPINPFTDNPPEGYSTWQVFDTAYCGFANGLWSAARVFLVAAESLGDVVAIVATVVTLIIPLLPAAWLAAIGGVTMFAILQQLVQIIVSEQASDILNETIDWMDAEKEEIICAIYSARYDFRGVPAGLMIAASDYIELSLTLAPEERNAIQNMVALLFSYTVILAWIADQTKVFVSDNPIDCSTCQQIGETAWEGLTPGTFCTNDGMVFSIYDSGFLYSGQISKEGEFGAYEWILTATMDDESPTPFSNRELLFANENEQGLTCIITAETDGGQQSVNVADGSTGTLDLIGLDCTAIQFKWQIGIYTLPCPQELSGYVTWQDAA